MFTPFKPIESVSVTVLIVESVDPKTNWAARAWAGKRIVRTVTAAAAIRFFFMGRTLRAIGRFG